MSNKKKIINDPIYGFVRITHDMLFDLIEHPYFQRLRRIGQVGLTHLVYPGATHSRFHHAIGAYHLMHRAIETLRLKDVPISEEEEVAAKAAILLHDIGHGPFSHALEGLFLPKRHEDITIDIMHQLNQEFGGKLELAIRIFTDQYERPFFHQLINSQIDVDRMDYLNRDSFYTGVVEGKIGAERLIQMMAVVDEKLVFEEKAIYTMEKFLASRKVMFSQVYLHKAALSAEIMLKNCLKFMLEEKKVLQAHFPKISGFVSGNQTEYEQLKDFLVIDDVDIIYMLKSFHVFTNPAIEVLSKGILERKLFKMMVQQSPFESDAEEKLRLNKRSKGTNVDLNLIFRGEEKVVIYRKDDQDFRILLKNGKLLSFSECLQRFSDGNQVTNYYICTPF